MKPDSEVPEHDHLALLPSRGPRHTQLQSTLSLGCKEAFHGSKATADEFLLLFHTTLKYYSFRDIIFR